VVRFSNIEGSSHGDQAISRAVRLEVVGIRMDDGMAMG